MVVSAAYIYWDKVLIKADKNLVEGQYLVLDLLDKVFE